MLARDGVRVRGGSVVLLHAGVVTDEATLRALLTRLTDVADGLDRAVGRDSTH